MRIIFRKCGEIDIMEGIKIKNEFIKISLFIKSLFLF